MWCTCPVCSAGRLYDSSLLPFLPFPLKPHNLLFPREGQGVFLHPITSQKGTCSGTIIFTLMLIITTVLFFYEQSFSLLLLLQHYPCYLLCIVKSHFVSDIFSDNSSLYAQEKVFWSQRKISWFTFIIRGNYTFSFSLIIKGTTSKKYSDLSSKHQASLFRWGVSNS